MATTSNEFYTPKHCNRHSYDCAMRQSHVNIGFVPEPPPSLLGAPPPYMATPVDYWQPAPPRILPYQPVHSRTVRCTHCYLERASEERQLFERRRRVMYALFFTFVVAPLLIFLIIMLTVGF